MHTSDVSPSAQTTAFPIHATKRVSLDESESHLVPRRLRGAGVPEGRVTMLSVAEALDEFEYRLSRLRSRRETREVDEFGLERGEEALCDGVLHVATLSVVLHRR